VLQVGSYLCLQALLRLLLAPVTTVGIATAISAAADAVVGVAAFETAAAVVTATAVEIAAAAAIVDIIAAAIVAAATVALLRMVIWNCCFLSSC
jgi:hypothetical protein